MGIILREEIEHLSNEEFVLTMSWIPFMRHISILGKPRDSSQLFCRLNVCVQGEDGHEIDPGWETSLHDRVPQSLAWAKIDNDREVQRLVREIEKREDAPPLVKQSYQHEAAMRFLKSVLGEFTEWYFQRALPFPSEEEEPEATSELETQGHRYALKCFPHLDEAENLNQLLELTYPRGNPSYDTVMKALVRNGFWDKGKTKDPRQKYVDFRERVRDYKKKHDEAQAHLGMSESRLDTGNPDVQI